MKAGFRFLLTAAFAVILAIPAVPTLAFAQSDAALQASAQKALGSSRFKAVQVTVQGGIATLTGSVDIYDAKANAEQKVRHVKGIDAVRNHIQVGGPTVSDAQLQEKLVRAIQTDRIGYGTTAFNSISVAVHDGVVTLGGYAWGPTDAASAVSVAANTKGVKDVIDQITVNPTSPNDDRIRRAAFRAIYGFPMLNKYAIDPAKPIRIQVSGGHITLYGQVDSKADKDAAGIRANSVPGVFSVDNKLQVAGAAPEK